ncbi:ribosome biogenesis factor YjgA [Marinobacterium sediminicola]
MDTDMTDFDSQHHDDIDDLPPSKSQLKRDAEELQELGKRMTELRRDQQEKLPIDGQLRAAIEEYARIKANGAKRRHLQYIGKLMRTADADAIREVVDRFDSASATHNQLFHEMERWRERLIDGTNEDLQSFIEQRPNADIQHLRQLVRNAQRERQREQAPAQARKLFRYIRELYEA